MKMKYFTIKELCQSATAKKLKIANSPSPDVVANLTYLVENLLDMVREKWGKPIHVNSGYRSEALNKAVGGKATSQHLTGQAADITTGNLVENRQLWEFIIRNNFKVDQMINENGYQWIHISLKETGNREQIFAIG
jgi:uncharacterized protein YcbK (DUF882 family)